MTTRTIKVDPTLNLAATVAKAQRAADRAAKKGLSGGFTVTTETVIETVEDQSSPFFVEGSTFNPTKKAQVTYLVIEGSPAKYEGWTFVALVEWLADAPVVTGSPYYEGPSVDRAALVKGACDHCGYSRARRSVIVVENEAGERKQVGKQCVKDYLGQDVPVVWFSSKDPFAEFDGYTGSGTYLVQTREVLLAASSVVRQRGFVSKANAQETGKESTASLVKLVLGPCPSNEYDARTWKELRAGFDATVDGPFADAAYEFGVQLDASSDYAANLQAVIAQDYCDPKYVGLVASLPGVYQRSLTKQAEEQAEGVTEEPYGAVGDKVVLTLKVVSSTAFNSQYGLTYVNTFTAEGRRFKWLTRYGFEAGETVTLKGTIKKYDQWNDKVFTVLTRCREVAA